MHIFKKFYCDNCNNKLVTFKKPLLSINEYGCPICKTYYYTEIAKSVTFSLYFVEGILVLLFYPYTKKFSFAAEILYVSLLMFSAVIIGSYSMQKFQYQDQPTTKQLRLEFLKNLVNIAFGLFTSLVILMGLLHLLVKFIGWKVIINYLKG